MLITRLWSTNLHNSALVPPPETPDPSLVPLKEWKLGSIEGWCAVSGGEHLCAKMLQILMAYLCSARAQGSPVPRLASRELLLTSSLAPAFVP